MLFNSFSHEVGEPVFLVLRHHDDVEVIFLNSLEESGVRRRNVARERGGFIYPASNLGHAGNIAVAK
jgi:hypothetical protein